VYHNKPFATPLLDVEPSLNRIKGYKHLPELKLAIQRELGIKGKESPAA